MGIKVNKRYLRSRGVGMEETGCERVLCFCSNERWPKYKRQAISHFFLPGVFAPCNGSTVNRAHLCGFGMRWQDLLLLRRTFGVQEWNCRA